MTNLFDTYAVHGRREKYVKPFGLIFRLANREGIVPSLSVMTQCRHLRHFCDRLKSLSRIVFPDGLNFQTDICD